MNKDEYEKSNVMFKLSRKRWALSRKKIVSLLSRRESLESGLRARAA
jgi:hypothetical protein